MRKSYPCIIKYYLSLSLSVCLSVSLPLSLSLSPSLSLSSQQSCIRGFAVYACVSVLQVVKNTHNHSLTWTWIYFFTRQQFGSGQLLQTQPVPGLLHRQNQRCGAPHAWTALGCCSLFTQLHSLYQGEFILPHELKKEGWGGGGEWVGGLKKKEKKKKRADRKKKKSHQ